jgi:Flp pilus assembly protein TadD
MTDADALVTAADRLIDIGRTDEGIAMLERVLAVEPQHVEALCGLARAHLNAHRFGKAREAAGAALQEAPDAAYVRYLYATVLARMGADEAVPAAEAAVVAAPDDWVTHQTLAEALHRAGRNTEAMAAARRIVELAPENANAQAAFADLASDLGQPSTARTAYQAALRLEPNHAHARHNLGTLRAGGSYRAAIHHMFEAATLDPTMTVAHENLSNVVRTGVRLCLALSFLAAVPSWLVTYLGHRMTVGVPDGVRVFVGLLVAVVLGVVIATFRLAPRPAWRFVSSTVRRQRVLVIALASSAATLGCLTAFAVTGWPTLMWLLFAPVSVGVVVNVRLAS